MDTMRTPQITDEMWASVLTPENTQAIADEIVRRIGTKKFTYVFRHRELIEVKTSRSFLPNSSGRFKDTVRANESGISFNIQGYSCFWYIHATEMAQHTIVTFDHDTVRMVEVYPDGLKNECVIALEDQCGNAD